MWEVIQSGGPLMVPLAACAILAIGYSIERFWVFSQLPSHGEAQESLERLEHALRDGGDGPGRGGVQRGPGTAELRLRLPAAGATTR